MPSFLAQRLARFSSREAMARILSSRLFSMPGSTFTTPILAVLMTPQRTGSMTPSPDSAKLPIAARRLLPMRGLPVNVSARASESRWPPLDSPRPWNGRDNCAFDLPGLIFLFVIPAKAGIQDCKSVPVALDPGFRRGDGRKKWVEGAD